MGIFDKIVKKVADVADQVSDKVVQVNVENEEDSTDADIEFFMDLEDPVIAHVTCDVLNVRSTPSTNEPRVAQLKRGAEITVLGLCDDWLKINFNGDERYVFGSYTDYDAPEMTVTASSLNVRKGPGTNYDKIGSLANGSKICALGEKGGWVKILHGKSIGYVSKDYLK